MSVARRWSRFSQSDVERALKGAAKAGVPVAVRVEAATGDLLIFPCAPAALPGGISDPDDIDAMIRRAKL
ncbi:MAG: hypothetical protein KGZ61_11560 [Sandarakinorhabdus sp.]|nr:hypothetical protein [Sandarakinorhabdus sp.]